MKAQRLLIFGLVLLSVLAIAAWMLRNTLIERLSGPLLAQYGLTITDVSLDALATRNANIGYLELRHASGATIAMDDVVLPIRSSTTGVRIFRVARIAIDLPDQDADEAIDYFTLLSQFLELPQQLPEMEINVGEIVAGDYPAVSDLTWQASTGNQELEARVDRMTLTAGVTRTSEQAYLLGLSFTDASEPGASQSLAMNLQQDDNAISMTGSGALDLRRWSPVIALLELDAFDVQSGSATLQLDSEIFADPDRVPVLHATFTPTTPVRMMAAGLADVIDSITMQSANSIDIKMTLPDWQWTFAVSAMALTVVDSDSNAFAVSLVNLSCTSSAACRSSANIAADEVELPFASIKRLDITSEPEIALGQVETRIRLQPGARLSLQGISGPDIDLEEFSATATTAADIVGSDSSWQLAAQSADVRIERYDVYEGVTFSAPLFVDALALEYAGDSMSASFDFYGAATTANWNGRNIRVPGARGRFVLDGSDVRVDFQTVGLYEQATVEVTHNLDAAAGALSFTGGTQSFDGQPLSARVTPWKYDWDLSAGQISLGLLASWQRRNQQWQVEADASVEISGLSGLWQDTAFAGLSTRIIAGIDRQNQIMVQPSSLVIDLVEMGLPVENISADYTLHPAQSSVDVRGLRMDVFGGVITAEPFSFSTASDRNNLVLIAESIDLARVLTTDEFETIEISGTIGARLPVTIEGQKLTISGGKLTGDAPGGVIRYLPGIRSDKSDTSGLGFATRALSNFEYETLSSDVSYGNNGDLVLQMRIAGRNPDFDNGRQIILNLGVENNVPQMLKSLQAARAVEEILERRLAQ